MIILNDNKYIDTIKPSSISEGKFKYIGKEVKIWPK